MSQGANGRFHVPPMIRTVMIDVIGGPLSAADADVRCSVLLRARFSCILPGFTRNSSDQGYLTQKPPSVLAHPSHWLSHSMATAETQSAGPALDSMLRLPS